MFKFLKKDEVKPYSVPKGWCLVEFWCNGGWTKKIIMKKEEYTDFHEKLTQHCFRECSLMGEKYGLNLSQVVYYQVIEENHE